MTLLSRVAWDDVNERVRHEVRNRETYVPTISLYRWWARRPHALIGALLDAACEIKTSPVISDPFSGGGTVALEAARRGLSVYAQDLHPWAVAGLASALDSVDAEVLEDAVGSLLDMGTSAARPVASSAATAPSALVRERARGAAVPLRHRIRHCSATVVRAVPRLAAKRLPRLMALRRDGCPF